MEKQKYSPVILSQLSPELKGFIPTQQFKALAGNDEIGEQLERLENMIKDMPQTYGQDGLGQNSFVFLHYFAGDSDWYITEKDMGKPTDSDYQIQAYGYVVLNGDTQNAEWGYVNIQELKSIPQVQLDFFWNPEQLYKLVDKDPRDLKDADDIATFEKVKAIAEKYSNKPESKHSESGKEISGITTILYEDEGDTILYGSKNNQTRISVKGLSQNDIKEELAFEKDMLQRQKKDLPNKISGNEHIQNSMTSSLKDKDDSRKLLISAKKNIEVLETIVIPFFESKIQKEKQYSEIEKIGNIDTTSYEYFFDRYSAWGKGEFKEAFDKIIASNIDKNSEKYKALMDVAKNKGILEQEKQMETQKEIVSNIALTESTKEPLDTIELENPQIIDNSYQPESNSCATVDTVVPLSMIYEMKKAMSTIDRRVNGVDEYVAEKLGYIVSKGCSIDQKKEGLQCLCDAYSAEQVDAIAVAIYNIEERGQAVVIGDQTGIGKGRIAAAIIRYAIKKGYLPMFLTEKPNLFSDMYRDLIAIGSDAAIPFEFLSDVKKEVKVKATRSEVLAAIKDDIENGDFEEDFNPDFVFTDSKEAKHELKQLIEVYREKYFEASTVMVDEFVRNKNYEKDIEGKDRVVPFIVNGGGTKTTIKDSEGNVLYKGLSKERTESVISKHQIPSDVNLLISTYSQFTSSKETAKKIFLRNIASKIVFILDESHNASGSSNSGTYLKEVLGASIGATFLSATFAKRPDNMPIYASKTAIQDAGLNDEQLVAAIQSGGVALQEIISSQLVAEGQMIRRERSFEGIEVNYVSLDASQEERGYPNLNKEQEHRAIADVSTEIVRDIISFQNEYVNPIINEMDDTAAAAGEEVEGRKGTSEAGVSNPPAFNGIFHLINQMLFSIKAESVAEIAIQRLKQGKKPIIAFASTMESFLDTLTNDDGTPVSENDVINADFSVVLKRRLLSVLRYTVISQDGTASYESIDPTEQNADFQAAYGKIMDKITVSSVGISISPIDAIIKKIEDAGYSVIEVTGRNRNLKLTGKGDAIVKNRKKTNTNDAFRMFNDNQVDCLLINQSGSTGASAHAVPTKRVPSSEVKQRVMIILQAELNINTEVQKRGRINRTGQIIKPIYDYVTSAIPAEKRLMMMLQKKLKSLDANTTSNQKQSKRVLDVSDFLNKYGDKVVVDYLFENKIINTLLGDPLHIKEEDGEVKSDLGEDKAHKVSGRVAILSTKMQEDFYTQMAERYASEVDYLVQTGEYDLEVESINLEAEPISKEVVAEGKGKDSLFGRNAIMEKVSANVLKKPFKKEELMSLLRESLNGLTTEDATEKVISDFRLFSDAQLEKELKEDNDFWNGILKGLSTERKYMKLESASEKAAHLETRKEEIKNARLKSAESIETSIQNKRNFIISMLKFFTIGKVLAYPTATYQVDNSFNRAVFLGFEINQKVRNPYAPSSMKLRFAIASSDKYISMPASKLDKIAIIKAITSNEIGSYEQNDIVERWTDLIAKSSTSKTIRYIVTGNVLLAFGIPTLRSKLISYTTSTGGVKKGILMPEHFSPDNVKSAGQDVGEVLKVNVPIHRAVKLIQSLRSGSSYQTKDNFSILRTYDDFKIIVPLNKKVGGKFYLDATIIKMTKQGRFDKSGSNMTANIETEKIAKLVNYLSEEFNCSIDLAPNMYAVIKGDAVVDYDDEVKFPSKEEVIIQKLTESDKAAETELETIKVNAEMAEKEAQLEEAEAERNEQIERESGLAALKLAARKSAIEKKIMKLILLAKKGK